jgi:chemotaxis signal transduction protein
LSESSEEEPGLGKAKARAQAQGESDEHVEEEARLLAPFVLMRLAGRWYAADAHQVQKVVAKGRITRVPGRSRHVLGLSLVHDTLIPIVDLAGLTGATGAPAQTLTEPRLVVLGEPENSVGVVADEAYGIEELPQRMDGVPKGVIAGETFWQEKQVAYLNVKELVAAGNDRKGPS